MKTFKMMTNSAQKGTKNWNYMKYLIFKIMYSSYGYHYNCRAVILKQGFVGVWPNFS